MRGRKIFRILLVLGILAAVILVGRKYGGKGFDFTKITTEFLRRPPVSHRGDALVGTTKTADEKPIRFAVLSDVHSDTENLQKALERINSDSMDFAIVTGDLTTLGKLSELQKVKALLDKDTRRYYVIPGNHDVYMGNKIGQDLFGQVFGNSYQSFIRRPPADRTVNLRPNLLPAGETPWNQDVKFILIDNASPEGLENQIKNQNAKIKTTNQNSKLEDENESLITDNQLQVMGVSQWSWIERETEECQRIMCLVFMHMPVNHPGSTHIMGEGNAVAASNAVQLVKLLVKNKVRQVFAGHLHYSSSYEIDGLKTQIVGSAASVRNWQSPRYLEVEVYGNEVKTKEVEIGP